MKFPRNARIFRGQLDAAPFAAVFFLLVLFLMLSTLMYTPGVRLQLPLTDDLPGTDQPTVSVGIDSAGRYYYENQPVQEEQQLAGLLRQAVRASAQPLTLAIHADRAVSYDLLIRLTMLGRSAGITNALLATLPRLAPVRRAGAGP